MEAIINISLHIKYLHFDSPTKRLITETKKNWRKDRYTRSFGLHCTCSFYVCKFRGWGFNWDGSFVVTVKCLTCANKRKSGRKGG